MYNPLISVIIPIYKVESYLRKCIDSVLSQTYAHIEVILVDDGSPDNCPKICDEYKVKDSRVRVIHKTNGGLSDARNAGIDVAKGEWLSFIDSDDWIETDMYEVLIQNAFDNNAQISVGGVSDDIETDDGIEALKTSSGKTEKTEILSPVDAMKRYLNGTWASWDKIYKREIFESIRYPVGEINEDEAIALSVLNKCTRIVYTSRVCYHYMRRDNSITTASFSDKKMVWFYHCQNNLDWIKKHYPELEGAAYERLLSSVLWLLNQIVMSEEDYLSSQKMLIHYVKNEYKHLYNNAADNKQKLKLVIIRYLPFTIYSAITRLKRG